MVLTIGEITQKLAPVFEQNGVVKAILFGSYAKGTATDDSDVDIVIETPPFESGMDFYFILGRLVDVLGKRVDLIPRQSIIPNDRVDIEVIQTGRVIYER
jgi:predicted nucleotidyltransferase